MNVYSKIYQNRLTEVGDNKPKPKTKEENKRIRRRKKAGQRFVRGLSKPTSTKHLAQKERLVRTSKRLKEDPPESEKWFMKLYEPYKDEVDEFNSIYECYIPDVMNIFYRYIIEIDGEIHQYASVKQKDIHKAEFFWRRGFAVFRVPAYDEATFSIVMDKLKAYRDNFKGDYSRKHLLKHYT